MSHLDRTVQAMHGPGSHALPPDPVWPKPEKERVEGEYEGFFSVVTCQACDYNHHLEGDVSSGEQYECEGCGRTMVVVNR